MSTSENRQSFNLAKVSRYTVLRCGCHRVGVVEVTCNMVQLTVGCGRHCWAAPGYSVYIRMVVSLCASSAITDIFL